MSEWFSSGLESVWMAAAAFAVLLIVNWAAGSLLFRLAGLRLPVSVQLALTPVLGYSLISLFLFWIHLVVPLSGKLALLGIFPALAGASLAVRDVLRNRTRLELGFRRLFPAALIVAVVAISGGIVLVPWFRAGELSAFGITNNDTFYYAITDWRVQQHTYLYTAGAESVLASSAEAARRWGMNYQSLLLRAISGLRSWESVQLVGAFALVLVALTGWCVARAGRARWVPALLCALLAGCNHFVFRLSVDGFLGFITGLPLFVATLILAAYLKDSYRGGLLTGIAGAGLTLFYYELLPLLLLCLGLVILMRRPLRLPLRGIAGAAAAWIVAAAGTLPSAIAQIRYASIVKMPGTYFDFSDLRGTALHLFGTVDLYQYLSKAPEIAWWQYAGAILAAIVVTSTFLRAARAHPLVPVLPLIAVAAYLLLTRKLEYQAHRMLALASVFLPGLLLRKVRSPLEQALMVLASVCLILPVWQLSGRAAGSPVRAGASEREMGDNWLRSVPPEGRVLIDVPDDRDIFYSHWMYLELLKAFDGNEKRIVFPRVALSYLNSTPPLDEIDVAGVTHVVRAHSPGRVDGNLALVKANARYKFLRVQSAALVRVIPVSGFLGAEPDGADTFRWASQDATLRVWYTGGLVQMTLNSGANPALKKVAVRVSVNGKPAGTYTAEGRSLQKMDMELQPGRNEVVLHSDTDPVPPGNGDDRKISFYVSGLRMIPAGVGKAHNGK